MPSRDHIHAAAVLALLGISCGSGSQSSGPAILTSHQDLCAGAAPEYAGGYVTMIACPFEQHVDNFVKFGENLPSTAALYDGTGAHVASITNTCDDWALGTDEKGVTVIVHRATGLITSHGAVHPGQPLSSVASPLALPVQTR
jgi:hypothetical protein